MPENFWVVSSYRLQSRILLLNKLDSNVQLIMTNILQKVISNLNDISSYLQES